ncbi:hypothetical protein L596_007724 [Steinernema carpocapsae]|uniref:Thioredoxin domain-containing protein n=1 Tax=Steinernema carpocapsae TaxID=34508 RepID=A0A4U5PAA9_STECR|nr:hypothetical protein L596_007724 [Steinernema carpocapsae]
MPRTCFLILVLTIIQSLVRHALFGEGRLATLKRAAPVPFFNDLSTSDFFTGNGASADVLLRNAEVSILMYYAPWSLHSMEMKDVYSLVGEKFKHQNGIKFSAVNCAANDGECKKSFKLFSFPIIVANIGRMTVLYQDAPTEENLFRWVYHILNPAIRIQSYDQFERVLYEYDRCVVGFFDFKVLHPGKAPDGYTTFIASAITLAQHGEHIQNVQFAVITNETLANKLGIVRSGAIRVFHLEDGIMFHEFPSNAEYKPQSIASWVLTSKFNAHVVNWISYTELELVEKSSKLIGALSNGTSVVLMTSPRSKLFAGASYSLFKRVAVEAKNCLNGSDGTLIQEQMEFWKDRVRNINEEVDAARKTCNRDSISVLEVERCCEMLAEDPSFCKESSCDGEEESCKVVDRSRFQVCPSIANSTSLDGLVDHCCHNGRRRRRHQKTSWNLTTGQKVLCEWAKITSWPSEPIPEDDGSVLDRCSNNKTLNFLAMDRSNYLYTKLGLRKGEDAVLIVDSKQDAFYILQDPLREAKQLREFINLYDRNLLESMILDEQKRGSVFSTRSPENENLSRLEKLRSAADIQAKVLARNVTHDSLVFFSGGSWHGPSMAVTHLVHAVNHYFSAFDSLIKTFVIDSSRNTLPYELRFDRLPALVFFPSRRSAQSVRYPSGLPVTLPNLLSFVLSRCQPELKWRIALSACSDKCLFQSPHRLRRQISILKVEISLLRRLVSTAVENRELLSRLVHQLIKRRTIQIRSARHLERLLVTIRSSKELVPNETDRFIKQTIFTQWVLYNNAFGLKYEGA